MHKAGMLVVALFMWVNALAQVFDKDTIAYYGNLDKHINLVILSDGYTNSELSKFFLDATSFTTALFNEIPFANYQKYFNVFIIKVPSNESGASHPGTATDVTEPAHPVITVDNYFGSTFDYGGIHRLLVATKNEAISNVLATNFPNYDLVLILVNSPYYGGSGGGNAVASTHELSAQIAIHELGHSFGGLSDEYWAGDSYAYENINMTRQTDPSLVRWKNWLGLNLIGIYQHCCGGSSSQWYKPHQNCKMEKLGLPFCSVCVQGTVEKIHSLITPIESYDPPENNLTGSLYPIKFKLNLIAPYPNTLKRNWMLNGSFLTQNIDSVLINANSLLLGTNLLSVTIEDTTQLLRVDNHDAVHISSVSWTIDKFISALSTTPSNQDVGYEAGSTTFTITSNTSWTVNDDADWLTVSPTSGSGNGAITATYAANTLESSRIGTITVSGTGVTSQPVTVTQGGISTLSVTPSNQDVRYEAGSTTFPITSNTSWTVNDDADWLTVSPTNGSGNGAITATYAANTIDSSRIGTITVSGTGVTSQPVTVIQSEPTIVNTLVDLKVSIYPNPANDFIIIKFDEEIITDLVIYIVDELGKSHYLFENKGANFDKEMIIDLTSINNGFYFVIIKSENIIKTYKITK